MSGDLRENLADLAPYQFRVARNLCQACDDYHSLWGYERLAGLKANSFETERDLLQPLLNANLPPKGTLLIAGAADAGLLSLILQSTRDYAPRITVADRCATPLAVCSRYADAHAKTITTAHVDLIVSPLPSKHDLAFAHNVLMLQPPDRHVVFLGNIRK